MIEKFVSDEKTIRLRNRVIGADRTAIPEQNIFSIDSLSLIIGDNGSGKTRTLEALIESMCSRGKADWRLEWTPVFFDDAQHRYGVVYFSQAPNRRKRRRHKNFVDASPSPRRDYPPEALFGHEELLRDVIKTETRFEAEMRADPRRPLRQCLELVLAGRLEPLKRWHRVHHDLAELRTHFENLPESAALESRPLGSTIRRLQQTGAQLPIAGIDPEFDRHCDHVARRLYEEVFEEIGDREALAFFIALDACVRAAKDPTEILVTAWSLVAFGMQPRSAKLDHRAVGQFQEHYRAALDVLDRWGDRAQTTRTTGLSLRVSCVIEEASEVSVLRQAPLDRIVNVGWRHVSSGQWALVTQCIELERAIRKIAGTGDVRALLVLIDEGDAFLHLEWQRQYVHIMDGLLARLKEECRLECLQAIIATHSPMLATDVPSPYVNRMRDGTTTNESTAFAAPLQTLLNNAFGASSIGEHAAITIRQTLHSLRSHSEPTARDRYVARIVDDPVIRRELHALLERSRGDAQ